MAQRARYQARLVSLEARADNLETQILNISDVDSYKFDAGEGSQQTKYRSAESMDKSLKRIYASIDRINRILDGAGLVNMNLRRKP